MATRKAKSLEALLAQLDARFPKRNKASDGWIASEAHLNRTGAGADKSQHNPNQWDVVCAIDITEDLSVGLDCNRLMAELDASNDPRIFYIIHDYKIDNSNDVTTDYNGSNPHTKHLHLSVRYTVPSLFDDGRPWVLPILGNVPQPSPWYRGALGSRVLRNGDQGSDVTALQAILARRFPLYAKGLQADGIFGTHTETVVREFQKRSEITVDGVVGRQTYRALSI